MEADLRHAGDIVDSGALQYGAVVEAGHRVGVVVAVDLEDSVEEALEEEAPGEVGNAVNFFITFIWLLVKGCLQSINNCNK